MSSPPLESPPQNLSVKQYGLYLINYSNFFLTWVYQYAGHKLKVPLTTLNFVTGLNKIEDRL